MGTKDVYPPDRASNLAVSGFFYKARAFQFHPLLTDKLSMNTFILSSNSPHV